jgi:glycosyltransferase involved in cell wall biosynthesis
MNLAVISHAYQDERYLSTLESITGHPGIVVTLIHPKKYMGEICIRTTSPTVRDIPVPVQFGSRQGTFLYHPRELAKALDQARPDVILHEQEVYSLGAGQIAVTAAKRSIPLVMFVWENVHRSLSLPRRILSRFVLARASGVIAGSVQALQVHRGWGLRGLTAVIPQMGVSACINPVYGRRNRSCLKVCFVGRLVPCKGVDCLLRAVADLRRRGVSVSCTIAGRGPELANLHTVAQQLGIQNRVFFCGQVLADGVQSLLRSSDVLVLPSRRTNAWQEQFGLVLTEAMAEATVTVGSKTGAIPEVIGSEDLLFEEDDFRSLASTLERLACDPHIYVDCQHHLWKRARDLYSFEQFAAQRVQFLRGVVARARAYDPEELAVGEHIELRIR